MQAERPGASIWFSCLDLYCFMAFSQYFWPYLRWYHSKMALVKLTSGLETAVLACLVQATQGHDGYSVSIETPNLNICSPSDISRMWLTIFWGPAKNFFTGRARCNSHPESQAGGQPPEIRCVTSEVGLQKDVQERPAWCMEENKFVVVLPAFQRPLRL